MENAGPGENFHNRVVRTLSSSRLAREFTPLMFSGDLRVNLLPHVSAAAVTEDLGGI